jgi:trans-aconitate methyltransferase
MQNDYNTQRWWNEYFVIAWEKAGGVEQTRSFMEYLIEALPKEVRDFLIQGGRKILDYGCAMGQGVETLKKSFPDNWLIGYDFSEVAISRAKEKYPNYTFTQDLDSLGPYDVVVNSNCLEHFHLKEMMEELERTMKSCRHYYVIMCPHNQEPAHSHFTKITEDTFPESVFDFKRISMSIVDKAAPNYPAKQIHFVYKREVKNNVPIA